MSVVPFAGAELWEPPADPRLLDEVESEVVSVVVEALLMYGASGTDVFADITPGAPVHTSRPYPFVLNASTMATVADGAFPYVVGDPLYRAIGGGPLRRRTIRNKEFLDLPGRITP